MSEPAPIELRVLPRLSAEMFTREADGDDAAFYRGGRPSPPLDHIALDTTQRVLGELLDGGGLEVLDLMAGADSHLPADLQPKRLVGLGLDEPALRGNERLDEVVLHDLNATTALPFPDASFDVVVTTFGVEYLTRPAEVFGEVGRVLRPGGLFAVVFTNRTVRRKAIRAWRDITERKREWLVADLMWIAGAFERVEHFRSVGRPRPEHDPFVDTGLPSDPIHVVFADRVGGDPDRPPRSAPDSEYGEPIDPAVLAERKRTVGQTLCCPYCEQPLTRWEIEPTPFMEWPSEFVWVCLHNRCSYLARGWDAMDEQGNRGFSYRLMYNPDMDACMATPVAGLRAMIETEGLPRG
jgi:SAM-dependent methyltransferase